MYFFYYYPIGVDVERPRIAWVTLGLIFCSTVIFLLSSPLAEWTGVPWTAFVYRPAMLSYLTPLTAVFLHGGWLHLIGNLTYLWVFGPALERALGRFGFLLVFVGTGYLGNLAHGAIVMNTAPEMAWHGVVGASGAISGLLGLFLLRFPYANVRLAWWAFLPLQGISKAGVNELPSVVGVLLWVLLQVIMMLVQGPAAGTAYGAHLGGLATGIVLALALRMPWKAATERWLVLGKRHTRKGEPHAAVGSLRRYLELVDFDDAARLEYARALHVVGDVASASREYRKVIDGALAEKRTFDACEVYSEARRGDAVFHLAASTQKRIAHFLEKLGRDGEAVTAYLDIVRFNQDHPDSVHAMVRAATLMITRLRRTHEGLDLFERARSEFPDHPLRDWLEQEHRKLLQAALDNAA